MFHKTWALIKIVHKTWAGFENSGTNFCAGRPNDLTTWPPRSDKRWRGEARLRAGPISVRPALGWRRRRDVCAPEGNVAYWSRSPPYARPSMKSPNDRPSVPLNGSSIAVTVRRLPQATLRPSVETQCLAAVYAQLSRLMHRPLTERPL